MTTYATFPLNPALSTQNLLGQTPPVGAGILYTAISGDAVASGSVVIDSLGYAFNHDDPPDAYYIGIPSAGSFSGTQLECTFDLNILTLVGTAGIAFGATPSGGTSNFGWAVGYNAHTSQWFTTIPGFGSGTTVSAVLSPGVMTGLRAVYVQGPGALTTITLYDNLGNVLITSNFAGLFKIVDVGFYFWHIAATASTTTTGIHIGNLSVHDVSTTPTGTALALTGFSFDGTSTPGSAWQGNVTGTAGHGSKTPMLVSLLPGGAASGSPIVFTPSDNGAGGTFSASTYTLTAGQTSMVIYYTPPATGSSVNISIANNASITAITNQAVTLTANVGAFLSNSFGAGFGLSSISQAFTNQIAAMVSDYTFYNFSITGETTTQIIAAMSGWIGSATGLKGSGKNAVIFWEITNDIVNAGKTAAQAYADAQTVYSNARSYGWGTVIAGALLARTGMSEVTRSAFNDLYVGGKGSAWDVLCPFQNDERIGSVAFTTSAYNQGDGTHPNFTGATIPATYFAEGIESGATGTPLSGGGSGGGTGSVIFF